MLRTCYSSVGEWMNEEGDRNTIVLHDKRVVLLYIKAPGLQISRDLNTCSTEVVSNANATYHLSKQKTSISLQAKVLRPVTDSRDQAIGNPPLELGRMFLFTTPEVI